MMCPVCGQSTFVKDSRLKDGNTIKRRRVCEGGHKFNTWESTTNITSLLESRRRSVRAWKARYPEKAKAANERRKRRQDARKESAATGEPVDAIYQRWGVA